MSVNQRQIVCLSMLMSSKCTLVHLMTSRSTQVNAMQQHHAESVIQVNMSNVTFHIPHATHHTPPLQVYKCTLTIPKVYLLQPAAVFIVRTIHTPPHIYGQSEKHLLSTPFHLLTYTYIRTYIGMCFRENKTLRFICK